MSEKIPYKNFSTFIKRSPLFPFNFINPLLSQREISEEQLMDVCRNPVIQEAIFLASPDLYYPMLDWLKGEAEDKDPKKLKRMRESLLRYITRMSARPTPFGLFAGFSVGNWANETRVELPPQAEYSRHTRMDMNYLCALALDLAKHPVIKQEIKYYPNSSAYMVGNQLRYVEYRYIKARRTHHIVAVDHSEYLQRVLDKAEEGAYFKELAELLVDDEITIEESTDFIDELIASQLLVHDLEPAITGPEFLDQILAVIENIGGIEDIKKRIIDTREAIAVIDRSKIGTTVDNYFKIIDDLKPLGTEFELKFMYQTDMMKPVQLCSLDQRLVDDVLAGAEALNRLTPAGGSNLLTEFRDAFRNRYETRELPLLHALDTECGLGYRQKGAQGDVSPLIDDLALPSTGPSSVDLKWTSVQSLLFKKYREALKEDKMEVEFTDKDFEPFEARWHDLPDTFSTMIQVISGKDPNDPDSKEKVFMSGFGGSGAGNLLGRFCHADQRTFDYVKEISAKEAELNPDVILAEIIHLPEARLGNILLRPVLRDYEIPYLGKAAVPREFQIKLTDLGVSVQGNRIVLRSRSLNKEIIPRLTSAHNYSLRALPIYHFLCDLQVQGLRGGARFTWGEISREYEFLPRVVYRNLVFAAATWNVSQDEIKTFKKIKDEAKLYDAVQEWRYRRKIPTYVELSDGDNKLLLNLESQSCLETLIAVTKNRPGFQLSEFLFDAERAVVKGDGGKDIFTNEFILSFYRTGKKDGQTKPEKA